MRRVLVLRPKPAANATVERARRLGLDAMAVPLFEIAPVPWVAPDAGQFDALLVTSANAIRHGGEALQTLKDLPVYAVGEATARAASEAGFGIACVGNGGVDRLLRSIPADLRLLHLCGEDRKVPSGDHQMITAIINYRTLEVPGAELNASSGSIALIHSPRAGRRLAELLKGRGDVAIAAISAAAAEAVGTGWQTVETARDPTDDALLALAARLCDKLATE